MLLYEACCTFLGLNPKHPTFELGSKGALKVWQVIAVAWIVLQLAANGFCLLTDDVGLSKMQLVLMSLVVTYLLTMVNMGVEPFFQPYAQLALLDEFAYFYDILSLASSAHEGNFKPTIMLFLAQAASVWQAKAARLKNFFKVKQFIGSKLRSPNINLDNIIDLLTTKGLLDMFNKLLSNNPIILLNLFFSTYLIQVVCTINQEVDKDIKCLYAQRKKAKVQRYLDNNINFNNKEEQVLGKELV